MPRIEHLVDMASAAAIEATQAYARADRLKAAAVAEAERIRTTVGTVDRFPSSQALGVLRLDNADKPAVAKAVSGKEHDFGDFLAQHDPGQAIAEIQVPADQLARALSALEFDGVVNVTATVRPGPDAVRWLDTRCVVQADPDVPRAWNVLFVDDEKHSHVVPGVTAERPVPRWVLVPAGDQKKAAAERGTGDAEEEIAALQGDDVTPSLEAATEPAAPVVPASERVPLDMLGWLATASVPVLKDACRENGLRTSGNKRDLLDRLTEHLSRPRP